MEAKEYLEQLVNCRIMLRLKLEELQEQRSTIVLNVKLFDASIITLFDAKKDSIIQNIQ